MNTGKRTGMIVSALGLIFSYFALKIDRAPIGNPIEPLLFPLILGIILVVCGIILFVMENREKTETGPMKSKGNVISFEVKMIMIICVTGVLYGLLLEKLGYILATALFLGTLLFAFNGKKHWLVNLTVAISFSIFGYYCFTQILGIPLPQLSLIKFK